MRKALPILFLLPFLCPAQVQLIYNPGFEDTLNSTPSSGRNKHFNYGYQLTQNWWQAGGSVDYYNSDYSTASRNTRVHKAHTGQGRLGLILGKIPARSNHSLSMLYREYAQTRLKQPMKAGALYSVNFYYVRDNRSPICSPGIDICFSNNVISAGNDYAMSRTPQLTFSGYKQMANTSKWTLAHGYYRAKGGENFLTLGNFNPETPVYMDDGKYVPEAFRNDFAWFAYYYIDDLYVYEVKDTLQDNFRDVLPKTGEEKPFNNLVFVLDVSASMQKDGKIKMLKEGVDNFISSLDTNEVISVITFDAIPRVLARHVKSAQKNRIISGIDSLKTSGGTNVNTAIQKAYELLDSAYIPGGNNRVILVTDAGFKVSDHTKNLIKLHAKEKEMGFSTLVFDNVKYGSIKKLCEKNNGSYSNMNGANTALAFNAQAKEKKTRDYGPGRKKAFTYLGTRALALGLLLGVILLTAAK